MTDDTLRIMMGDDPIDLKPGEERGFDCFGMHGMLKRDGDKPELLISFLGVQRVRMVPSPMVDIRAQVERLLSSWNSSRTP